MFTRMLPSPTEWTIKLLLVVEGQPRSDTGTVGAHGQMWCLLSVDTAVVGRCRGSPTSGHTGTPFTFSVRCRDADAPENWMETGLPRVCVIVGNQKLPMAYVEGDVREASGALYQTTTKLPAGSLMHSFTAEDGFDTATLADENGRPFAGPMVLPETRLNLTITPEQLTLDGLTPIRVSGALDPVIPSTDVKVTYAWMVADGQPVEMHVNTVTATSEGRFTDAFVPVRSGRWQVTAEFASDAERDGGSYEQLVAGSNDPTNHHSGRTLDDGRACDAGWRKAAISSSDPISTGALERGAWCIRLRASWLDADAEACDGFWLSTKAASWRARWERQSQPR